MHNLLDSPRDTSAWIISGTDSFRLSSKQLFAKKQKGIPGTNFGGNRQNIEKSIRKYWQADEGFKLCQVDQAGAEALIVAYLCRPGKYRSLFKNEIKPHTYLGLKLFKNIWKKHFYEMMIENLCVTPIPDLKESKDWKIVAKMVKESDDWKPTERYYHFSKKTIHAGSYGMRGNTFRQQLLKESGGIINLTAEQGDTFIMGFHAEFPEIREYHETVLALATTKHELRNLFGFPYRITQKILHGDIKDLIAWTPQSTVACITRQAYVRFQEYIEVNKKNWHLLNDCHDSYMAEAPEDEILECAKVMKSFLEIELKSPYDGTIFKMKSAASIGDNWGPKKEDNLEGLEEVSI